MFSKEITNSSEFLMMSQSAQNLYFHFGMNADDDGFCEVFTVMRMTDSKPDDLKSLHERGFVFVADTKVCIIKDWHENNQLRTDRYKPSKYLEDPKYVELYRSIMEDKIKEISVYSSLLMGGKPDGNQMEPQDRLGKVRIGKERIERVASKVSFEPIDRELSEFLLERIKANTPTFKSPNIENWAAHIRLMRERDGRTEEQIRFIIDWCQKDVFWQANILSTSKLREKFDTLVAQMKRKSTRDTIKKSNVAFT